ncbi:hypothetical protein MVEN_01612100 [Mycena venus]|uniref:Uncharacterized protein n=1 Tax=Mycena venus TaxID=2733690 RepID=A0A8H6XQ28_9AGAR|nr:hypothetical protein MVEN_01612100 [Mycena venus]
MSVDLCFLARILNAFVVFRYMAPLLTSLSYHARGAVEYPESQFSVIVCGVCPSLDSAVSYRYTSSRKSTLLFSKAFGFSTPQLLICASAIPSISSAMCGLSLRAADTTNVVFSPGAKSEACGPLVC